MPEDYYSITREALRRDGTAYVRLGGTLDIGARLDLCETFAEAREEPGVTAIVADLADVTFLDSEALAGLIEGFNEARRAGLRFQAVGARGLVHRVLAVTGTLAFFTAPPPRQTAPATNETAPPPRQTTAAPNEPADLLRQRQGSRRHIPGASRPR